jgi:hypothetical protein
MRVGHLLMHNTCASSKQSSSRRFEIREGIVEGQAIYVFRRIRVHTQGYAFAADTSKWHFVEYMDVYMQCMYVCIVLNIHACMCILLNIHVRTYGYTCILVNTRMYGCM